MPVSYVSMSTLTNRLVHEYGLGILLQTLEQPVNQSTFRDTRLASAVMPEDRFRGAWVRTLSAGMYGQVRQVSEYDPLTGTISVYPPFPSTPVQQSTIEIWFLYDPSFLIYDINSALKKIKARKYIGIYDTTSFVSSGNDYQLSLRVPQINKSSVDILWDVYASGYWNITADYNSSVVASGTHYGRQLVRATLPLPTTETTITFTSTSTLYGGIIIDPDYQRQGIFFEESTDITNPSILRVYEYPYDKYPLGQDTYRHWTSTYDLLPVDNWAIANNSLIVNSQITRPLVCLADTSTYPVNIVPGPGIDYSFEANEELLLAHIAYNVFARLKSVANMSVENTQWVDAQLARAREIISIETRDEDMRRRSTRPSSAEWVYTGGDTYLGGIW